MGHGLAVSDPGVWFWWVGLGVLLVIELMSGTFYLLMIALGFLLAGLSRLMGASGAVQVLVAAVFALVAVAGVRFYKRAWRQRKAARAILGGNDTSIPGMRAESTRQGDASGSLDIGASVWVEQCVNGRARVAYRGAQWDAILGSVASEATPDAIFSRAIPNDISMSAPGWYHIHRIDGIRLILLP